MVAYHTGVSATPSDVPDPAAPPSSPLVFRYRFEFENGTEQSFEVRLQADTLQLLPKRTGPAPGWTRLEYCQCENCPLPKETVSCPVAVNLAELVETFKTSRSIEHARVTVDAPNRSYVADTTLQRGISAIGGLIMATSGCPIMDHLRPLTRFHLPFATSAEMTYRIVSMYLTQEYLRMQKGHEPDWQLDGLRKLYSDIRTVNVGMANRVRTASKEDASVNAIIILASGGEIVAYTLEDGLADLAKVLTPSPLPTKGEG